MRRTLFAFALVAALCRPAAADDKVLFQLDWIPTGEHAA